MLYASRHPAQGERSFKQVAPTANVGSGFGPYVTCSSARFCAEIMALLTLPWVE